jgi:hypothetical protein
MKDRGGFQISPYRSKLSWLTGLCKPRFRLARRRGVYSSDKELPLRMRDGFPNSA